MSTNTTSKQLRHRKRIAPTEPVEFERITITIPKGLLKEVDYIARLYQHTRSSMIQSACDSMADDLIRADWIKAIFQEKDVRRDQGAYDVDKIISRLFEEAPPGPEENSFQLTPPQIEFVKTELEKSTKGDSKNRWREFCEKCSYVPDKISNDRPTVLVPPEKLIG